MDDKATGFRVTSSWAPTPVASGLTSVVRTASGRDRAGLLLLVVGGTHVVAFVLRWLPELLHLSPLQWLSEAARPLVSEAVLDLEPPGLTELASWAQLGGLGGLLLLTVLRRHAILRSMPVVLMAGTVIIAGCLAGVVRASGTPALWATALLALATAYLTVATCRWALTNPAEPIKHRSWVPAATLAAGVTVLPAVAVGRALEGESLVWLARDWEGPEPLATLSSVWFWMLGVVVLAGTAAVAQLLSGNPSRGLPVATLVVAAVLVAGPLGDKADSEASASFAYLQDRPESGYCQIWWREGSPDLSIAFSEDNCQLVSNYEGKRVVTSRILPFALDDSTWRGPVGYSGDETVHSALYEDTVVVTAVELAGQERFGLLGLDFHSGTQRWFKPCPPGVSAVRARFSNSGDDDPQSFRVTQPGERSTAYLTCGDEVMAIEAVSGRLRWRAPKEVAARM